MVHQPIGRPGGRAPWLSSIARFAPSPLRALYRRLAGSIARLLLIALTALHRRLASLDCPAPPHRASRSASSPGYGPAALTVTVTVLAPLFEATTSSAALGAETTSPPVTLTW